MDNELETRDSYINSQTHSILSSHPLTKFIMERTPLIMLANIDATDMLNDNDAAAETLEEYIRNPSHHKGMLKFLSEESRIFYNLMLKADKLQHTIYMLQFFPDEVEDNTMPITKAEYLENILELYVINSLGIQDRIHELIRLTYDIKIPKHSIGKKEIIMRELSDLKLLKELKLFDQVLSDIRKSRNVVVHEASYYEENLENIFQQEIRFREYRLQTRDEGAIKKRADEINRQYDVFVRDKTADLYMNDSILTKLLKEIFDIIYKQHKVVLKGFGYNSKDSIKPTRVKKKYTDLNSLREQASIYNLDLDDILAAVELSSIKRAKENTEARAKKKK